MENEEKEVKTGNIPERERCGKAGKSQSLQDDETNTDDLVGTSHYEKAEADLSKGIFAEQTAAHNQAMDKMLKKDAGK